MPGRRLHTTKSGAVRMRLKQTLTCVNVRKTESVGT